MDEKTVESLWVRIREQSNMGVILLGVCYRSLGQEEGEDKVVSRHLEKASH